MKKIATIAAVLCTVEAMATDLQTVVFTTEPQMHCESCENRIKNNIRFEKGIKRIETNVEEQTVTIKYDAEKTTPENIQEGFKKIGYSARLIEESEKAPEKESNGTANE